MTNCKNCIHEQACAAWIRHSEILYNDFEYDVENCPYYISNTHSTHGQWINIAPYYASNGSYNKAQECSVCHAFFVSPGNTPYSNHPYCCECGARMDGGN